MVKTPNEASIRTILQRRKGGAPPEKPQQALTIDSIREQLLSDPDFMPQLASLIVSGVKQIERGEAGPAGPSGPEGKQGEPGRSVQGPPGEEGPQGPVGPQGREGKRGPAGVNGKDGKNGKDGRDGSPDTAQQIAAKLDAEFKDDERFARVKDLPATKLYDEKKTKTATRAGRLHRGGGGSPIYGYDLSDQCDGSNKTFTVPSHSRAIMLIGTDTPIVYKPTTDYTISGTTLSLTSAVPAPISDATLIFEYAE